MIPDRTYVRPVVPKNDTSSDAPLQSSKALRQGSGFNRLNFRIVAHYMQPGKIIPLQFDDTMPIGIETIPIDNRYVQESQSLTSPHRASFFCVLWFIEGTPTHMIDFIPITIKPGSFLFVGKNRLQFFDQHTHFKAKVLLFTDTFFSITVSDNNFLTRTSLFNQYDNNKYCLLEESNTLKEFWNLIEQQEKTVIDSYKPLILRNHLANFLLQAEREAGLITNKATASDNHLEVFFNFKDLLEKHFKEQQSVAFYIEQLNLSGKALARVTQRLSGQTPKQLINERLLLEAKRLLIYNNEAGKSIGYSLGFTDPTNFIKFFRKHTGKSPTAFRKFHHPSEGQ